MYKSTVLLVVSLVANAYGSPESYVMGGVDAAPGSYPHQVSIRFEKEHFCSGTIIDKRNILTAGSCANEISALHQYFTVHAGTNLLSQPGTSYKIHSVRWHEDYFSGIYEMRNDIGIITLAEDIIFTPIIKPIQLDNSMKRYGKEKVMLTGWGSKGLGASHNDRLQEVELWIVPHGHCKLVFLYLYEHQICAFAPATGLCEADMGNPLMLNGKQIGIASYGQPCGNGVPDVYTRVSLFIDWIEKNKSNSGVTAVICRHLLLLLPLFTLFYFHHSSLQLTESV